MLLESKSRRTYERMSSSDQYAPAAISFLEKGLQGVSINLRAPNQ
jgi:hypothetical protein